jgi:quinol monooxygenase YgiN
MAFIQIIDSHTSKFDEVNALEDEWRAATEGKRTLRRSVVGRDRNDPSHFVIIAFFDSYEAAMENSSLPETGQFAEKMEALADKPSSFYDLDVVMEHDD